MPDETLLAFDYGTQFIGIAVGNTLTAHARPLEVLGNTSRDARFARIDALIKEWQPGRLVVGLSLNVDGEEQPMTAHCRKFANQLKGRFGLPVVLVDERGTSLAAQSEMGGSRRGKRVDAVAAAIILQSYFDEPPTDITPESPPDTPHA
ncbi:Holliday junction resolvase RuvX [Pigmentiphaga litoralis]|uniref:Putative pre-16S rRNA nuclease n=1 Tax=Pigmentiphaga litoralis TaxID=516702 RepID=A0A7Y9IS88_9BURK|nr:Holliday junction resolvase RuvX [Pigmentiphaga litoralis]NYE24256.1 putative Holliday junction resolvase [Pigmentiphaga litoralis]NYE82130.1 putative Holliday junction resolvase [Pigmentiphaga litoralis]